MTATIGIVGAGSIVERYYLTALKQLGYRQVLLYDVVESRARELAHQHGLVVADLATIQSTADTIVIATPPHTHVELIDTLLAPHKIIICEKPFVLTKADAIRLTEKAEQLKARLVVAHIRRIFPGIQLAQQYIQHHGASLGVLQQARLLEGARFNYQSVSGYVHNHPMGGVLADTGSHVLDSLLFVTGLDTQPITCSVDQIEKDQSEPAHSINCTFRINTIPVQLRLSRYEALANTMTLYYEHATLIVPLGIKPAFRITTPHATDVHSAADSCLTYFSQAFREELKRMLHLQDDRFNATRFINLSTLLETLYRA